MNIKFVEYLKEEFVDQFRARWGEPTVFKNPTSKELAEMKFAGDFNFRFIANLHTKTIWAWKAGEAIHTDIIEKLHTKIGIPSELKRMYRTELDERIPKLDSWIFGTMSFGEFESDMWLATVQDLEKDSKVQFRKPMISVLNKVKDSDLSWLSKYKVNTSMVEKDIDHWIEEIIDMKPPKSD